MAFFGLNYPAVHCSMQLICLTSNDKEYTPPSLVLIDFISHLECRPYNTYT